MADQSPPVVSGEGRVSFTRLFLRFLVIVFGFSIAVFVAGLVGTFGLYRGLESDVGYAAFFAGTAVLAITAAAHTTFVPFVVLVLLAEALRLRSALVYLFAGGAIAAYAMLANVVSAIDLGDRRMLVAVAAGIVGGFAYWAVAGRMAGDFRERRYVAPSASGSPEA